MKGKFILGAGVLFLLIRAFISNAEEDGLISKELGPYYEYVNCFNALRGKTSSPNQLQDTEVFLPLTINSVPGVIWYDHTGFSHFFNLEVDSPESKIFRKNTIGEDHWIADISSMKRFSYRDPENQKTYHYGFFIRTRNKRQQEIPFRFVWIKDKDFKTNEDIKYQPLAEFNKSLVSVRKKWGRRIYSRSLVVSEYQIEGPAGHDEHPQIKKAITDEISRQIAHVYTHLLKTQAQASIDQEFYDSVNKCKSIDESSIQQLVDQELEKIKKYIGGSRSLASTREKESP